MKYSIAITLFAGVMISACAPQETPSTQFDPVFTVAPDTATWTQTNISHVTDSGLLKPNVVAKKTDDTVHIAFMESAGASSHTSIQALQWSIDLKSQTSNETTVQQIDNSATLAASVTPQNSLQLAYQGGETRECQEDEQSDIMLNTLTGTWQEQTAAIGYVERNPAFPDGLAGGNVAMATDDFGTTHIAYQFFYEGCDANAFSYPDIKYVAINEGSSALPIEENVDANIYSNQGHQLVSIRAGDFSDLVIDNDKNPVILYSAENKNDSKRGLKVATLTNSSWENEWIEDDCLVEGISAATAPNGNIGVSYYTTQCANETYRPRLHYAERQQGIWRSEVINTRNRNGQYPALAYDSNSQPFIASLESETFQGLALKNLLLSSKIDGRWGFDTITSGLEFGYYNNVWLDNDDSPIVLSYSTKFDIISIFEK